jgi:hypothetical protein
MNECPVFTDLQTCAGDLQRTLRRIGRNMKLCRACELNSTCPAPERFRALVRQATAETLAEWRSGKDMSLNDEKDCGDGR